MEQLNHSPSTSHDDVESDLSVNDNNSQIHLRVPKALVCPFRSYDIVVGEPYPLNNLALRSHIYLLSGETAAFSRYAGTTVDWLIKIARLICEPQQDGMLLTHPADNTLSWYDLDRTPAWTPVAPGDPLRPGVYEFCPVGSSVTLSQISDKIQHSLTASANRDQSGKFRDDLLKRDGCCIVSKNLVNIRASHLVPKRMGEIQTKELVERFCGAAAAQGMHRFHPGIGVSAWPGIDGLIDLYSLGLYHLKGDTYEVHNFHSRPDLTMLGSTPIPGIAIPPLHRLITTLTRQPGSVALPHPGIFMWHYMQCAIHRFGTSEYKIIPRVKHYEYPFCTSDDSEEEYGDDEENPPWPSYYMDMAVEREAERHRMMEQRKSIHQWSSMVS